MNLPALFVVIWMTVGGLTDADVILVNDTGLDIATILIDDRNLHELKEHDKILVSVTPTRHHVKLVFRGGGDIDWPKFDFRGIHEIFFERDGTSFRARLQ